MHLWATLFEDASGIPLYSASEPFGTLLAEYGIERKEIFIMSIQIDPKEPQPNVPQPGEPKLPDIDPNPKPYPVSDPPYPESEPEQPQTPDTFPGPPEPIPVFPPNVTF